MMEKLPKTRTELEALVLAELRAAPHCGSAVRHGSPALPDVPTIAETVPGYEANGLVSPAIKARYADLGITPLVLSPSEFGKFVADDTQRWAKVIPAAHDASTACRRGAWMSAAS